MNKSRFEQKFIKIALGISSIILASTVLLSPVSAQQIVPDGVSKTHLNVNGNITDVSTSTIRGNNAYNTFEKFNVNQGNTVNLHIPESAKNLVNLIYNEKTNIDGILNGLKYGRVDGNIFLINPHGITVGREGVINVGSLTAITPTMDEMKNFDINSQAAYTKDFKNMELNREGAIWVKGKINAQNNISLNAGWVRVEGKLESGLSIPKEEDKETNNLFPQAFGFGDIVNIGGDAPSSTTMLTKGSTVEIKTVDNIILSGADLIANKGNLKFNSSNGGVSGYGSFDGDVDAHARVISLINTQGDLNIDSVDAWDGKVQLWSEGSITNAKNSFGDLNIRGTDITLGSLNGDIGSGQKPVQLYSDGYGTPISMNARANRGSIFLNNYNPFEDLHIKNIEARDRVYINNGGNILSDRSNRYSNHITADRIDLISGGGIGDDGNSEYKINIQPFSYSSPYAPKASLKLNAQANNNIILNQGQFDLKVDQVRSYKGEVMIIVEDGSILDGNCYENENITAKRIHLVAKNGNIGSKSDDLDIDLTSVKDERNYLFAEAKNGIINISQLEGDLRIGNVSARSEAIITADKNIIGDNGGLVEAFNVVLHSQNGSIGTEKNALGISSYSSLTAFAPNGSINLAQDNGEDLIINFVIAGGDVKLSSGKEILSSSYYPGLNIVGNNVSLFAESIGRYNNPLGIKHNGQLIIGSQKDRYYKEY